MAIKVLSKVTLEGKKILADKGYFSEEIRNFISQEKAEVCIPDKSNAVVIHNFDKELYKSRNIIERFFSTYKKLSTHCDAIRQIVRVLFKFCSSRRRHDQNLDFTNTP